MRLTVDSKYSRGSIHKSFVFNYKNNVIWLSFFKDVSLLNYICLADQEQKCGRSFAGPLLMEELLIRSTKMISW